MTTQQSFKRRIRSRMEKTGESYTAARAQLLTGDEPQRISLATSDATIRERTAARNRSTSSSSRLAVEAREGLVKSTSQ